MEFTYHYKGKNHKPLKHFLKEQGISKKLLAKIKFQDGKILVNHKEENVLYLLQYNDIVTLTMPSEPAQEMIEPIDLPIHILYEDEYLLIVNKPSGVSSIPSFKHPKYSMANRVKNYYDKQQYVNRVIHVVTRLDKDTSGVMVFAKHQIVHSFLDRQLRRKEFYKSYIALASKSDELLDHGIIDEKIGRSSTSIITREVRNDGKESLTEYWKVDEFDIANLYRIQLHTGRTHQIRVHFSYKGAPLIGDELYGGIMCSSLKRQALHCEKLVFSHPFTNKKIEVYADVPQDIENWIKEHK